MPPVPIQDKCPGHGEQVSGWKWWDLRKRADFYALSFSPADVQKMRMFKILRQGHVVKGRGKGESGKDNRPSKHVLRIWDPSQDWRKADRWAVSRLWKKEGFQRGGISEWNKTKERLRGMRCIANLGSELGSQGKNVSHILGKGRQRTVKGLTQWIVKQHGQQQH